MLNEHEPDFVFVDGRFRLSCALQSHIRSEASERVRVLIGARERLIRMRKDLEGHVRGVLKVFGVCMASVGTGKLRRGFRDQLAAAVDTDPAIAMLSETFIPLHKTLCRGMRWTTM